VMRNYLVATGYSQALSGVHENSAMRACFRRFSDCE
jgi:hypothetical protein